MSTTVTITPSGGSSIGRYDSVQVDVVDADGLDLSSISIWVSFDAGVTHEPVMVAGSVDGGYLGGWCLLSSITNGQRHVIKRPGGWKANWSIVVATNGGGAQVFAWRSVSASTSVNVTDQFIEAKGYSAAVNLALPTAAAAGQGRCYILKDHGSGASGHHISLVPNGSETIDGVNAPFVISIDGGSVTLVSDGVSNWEVI